LGGRDDAEAVADVFVAAKAQMTYLPEIHTEAETRRWIRDVVLRRFDVWVAEDDGRVIGFAALGDEMLEHLYVQPGAQGRGFGTALLTLMKAERPAGLRLWVFQKNQDGRRFYERHGFTLVRLTDGQGNEEGEPDALYEWSPPDAPQDQGADGSLKG
jgi:GNAT superfamily N-acetyltransferase